MRRMIKNLKLYVRYVSVVLSSTMQYKLSFLLMTLGRIIISFNGFIAIFFLFSSFKQIKGYTYTDILLCFSIIQMSFSIAEGIGNGFKAFTGIVRRGEFDRMLLRPCSPILQILGTKFELGRLGPIITAIITMVIGITKSQINWEISKILTLIFMVVGGVLLFLGLFLLGACFCFFTIDDAGIFNILTYGARDHGKYPIDVYGKGLMRFCTYIIPYTLVQYYPLQYLLGKTDHWQYALYPIGAIIFLVISYGFWLLGLRNYKSCGN